MRCPGIEPGSQAWKASMITTTLATLHIKEAFLYNYEIIN